METGAITSHIDVAQVVLYVFWAFFAGLIFYLVRENKREGYPLESKENDGPTGKFFPAIPEPKDYHLPNGETVSVPNDRRDPVPSNIQDTAPWDGAPLVPTGNPMIDGVGPAAWAERADRPDMTSEDTPRIVPLRVAGEFGVDTNDVDPRGKQVMGADRKVAGTVSELWVDVSERLFRYLEVDLSIVEGGRKVLLPINFCRIGRGGVMVSAILAEQFKDVPAIAGPDQITLLEEDKICAYYNGGRLYATAARAEPIL
ncbi:MAG: photosynthetic reaction center subunit H [Geminicoccaceae bacterium]